MTVDVRPFGDGAFQGLAEAVGAAQESDPLAPVTVVVERSALGLASRRRLASAGPVANVRFSTWSSVAAQLAAGWLASNGRRLVTPALEHEAVRAVLAARHDGLLAGAREQPGTVRALSRTYRDLAHVADGALDALAAQSPRAAEVVAVVREARAALSHCYDAEDVLGAAAAEVRRTPVVARVLGTVVVYQPGRATRAELDLLEALASRVLVVVVASVTGDPSADEPVRAFLGRLQPDEQGSAGSGVPGGFALPANCAAPPVGTWVRSAPSADAEVLMALRHLMRRHAEGTALERMAILHGGAAPYPRLIHDMAALAGLPVYGGSPRALSQSVAGRALLGLLALADRDWRRDDVMAWLACGPLLFAGKEVPAAEWDVLSCEAGVVSGLDHWRDRLAALAASRRRRAQLASSAATHETEEGRRSGASADRLLLEAQRCEELAALVAGAAARLAACPATWRGWGEWARQVLVELLGGPARHAAWPTEEIAALDTTTEALGALEALDEVRGPPPSLADFRTALGAELDRPAPETTRFGQGLLVGRVADAVGLDLDVVCVVGMVDGAFFGRAHDDVLLPDRERERAGSSVPLRGPSHAEERRDYFAALASAPERVLSYARADQRQGRELRPARLLLDTLEHFAGEGVRLFPRDVHDGVPQAVPPSRFQFVRSFAEAVRDDGDDGEPISVADWSLRSLARAERRGDAVSRHFLAVADPVLRDALAARANRRSARFTRFDGLVDHVGLASLTAAPQAATKLEAYARCPRSFLFETVLGVHVRTRPEAVLQISALERGLLMHAVLERLVSHELSLRATGTPLPPLADVERKLAELADAAFAELEARGLTGHRALWALERARILGDLQAFVRSDAEYRASTGAEPVAVELDFGSQEETAVAVDARSGRTVRFRGRIDRVDRHPGGSVAVIDYKSGAVPEVAAGDDPLAGGTRLQLPVYALAARRGDEPTARTRAGYWSLSKRSGPVLRDVDDELLEGFRAVVSDMVDAIEGGQFPANPGKPDGDSSRGAHCRICAFDAMCPPDRAHSWRRKQMDASVGIYLRLSAPRVVDRGSDGGGSDGGAADSASGGGASGDGAGADGASLDASSCGLATTGVSS